MKIQFDERSTATYSGFSQITPPPDTRRQELINRIRHAEERTTRFKDADTLFKQRSLADAKHALEVAQIDLALHDAGLNERNSARESYHIVAALSNIRALKSVTAFEIVIKAINANK